MNLYLLLDTSIKVTIILALTGLLTLALQKSTAAARHLVWSLALVGLLVLPFLTEMMPRIQAPIMPVKNEPLPIAVVQQNFARGLDDSFFISPVQVSQPSVSESTTPLVSVSSPRFNWQPDWTQILAFIWGAGSLFLLLRLAGAVLKIRKILSAAALVEDTAMTSSVRNLSDLLNLHISVKLLVSAEIAMPVTAGIKRPVIFLPLEAAEWDADWLRVVLLHELAHVKRRDCLTQLLANIACAIYWFNPLVWFAAKQLRKERELACDDAVLALGTKASDYAGYLVAIAKAFDVNRQMAAVTVGMACSQLEKRVRTILNPQIRRGILSPAKVIALASAIALIIVPLASLQATSQGGDGVKNSPDVTPQNTSTLTNWPGDDDFVGHPQLKEKLAKLSEEKAALEALQTKALEEKLTAAEERVVAKKAAEIAKLQAEIDANFVGGAAKLVAREDAIGAEAQADKVAEIAKEDMVQAQAALVDAQRHEQKALLDKEMQAQQKADENSLTPNNLVQMKIHGVTPEYIQSMRNAGLGELSIRQIIELKIHGIDEAYIKNAQQMSGDKLSARDIIQLKISGLNAEYINAMKQAGFDNLSLRKLSHMRLVGVTPEFAASIKRAGYDNLTAEQLTQMKVQGITPEYIQQTQSWGFGKLSFNDLIQAKIFGASPEDVKTLQALGFSNVNLKELMRVKIHGVNAVYIKEMRDVGFSNLTLDQLINMKLHGVDADYVKKMCAAGFKNISANQLLEMKIRGIDSILLKN